MDGFVRRTLVVFVPVFLTFSLVFDRSNAQSNITLTSPFPSCQTTMLSYKLTDVEPSGTDLLDQGFGDAVATCDASNGVLNNSVFVFGGSAGNILEDPSQVAEAEGFMELSYIPDFTGTLGIEATLVANATAGTASASATALIDFQDVLLEMLQKLGVPALFSPFLEIADAMIFQTASGVKTNAFVNVDTGETEYEESVFVGGHGLVSSFPVQPHSQNMELNSEEVLVSLSVPVSQGQEIAIRVGIRTRATANGWASAYWNIQGDEEIHLSSVVLTAENGVSDSSSPSPSDPSPLPAEVRDQIIEAIEERINQTASYTLSPDWRVVSAQRSPTPNNGFFQFYPVDELWCIVIDPPLQAQFVEPQPDDRHIIVGRTGLSWRAILGGGQETFNQKREFLEASCTNYTEIVSETGDPQSQPPSIIDPETIEDETNTATTSNQIVFMRGDLRGADGLTNLYLLDLLGNTETLISNTSGIYIYPSWSWDGSTLLFTYSSDRSNWDVYTLHLPTGTRTKLTNGGLNWAGQLSPDGTKALFWTDPPNPAVYAVNLGDGSIEEVINDGIHRLNPTWKPNSEVVIYSKSDGGYEIYELNLVTGVETRLTEGYGNAFLGQFPFSPDGKLITFSSNKDGDFEVYLLNTESLEITQITDNADTDDENPSWSLDGNSLVFASNGDGDYEIFAMTLSDNERQQLTTNDIPDIFPSWRP